MALYTKPQNINIIWSSGGDRVTPDAAKIATGWLAEIPPRQYFNYIDWKQDQYIAYSNQIGIPEWDNITEYQANKSVIQGSNGAIYQCLVTNTGNDPITDVGNRWRKVAIEEAPANGNQYVRRNNAWQVIDSSAFAPAVHTHPIDQVVGLQNALNNKLNITGSLPTLNSTGNVELRLTSSPANSANFIRGMAGNTNSWYLGKIGVDSTSIGLHNYASGTTLAVSESVVSNKEIYVNSSRVWHEGNFTPGNYLPSTGTAIAAERANRLTTARTIGGVSFDGTANINLPGVNTTGNQGTTGNAATATRLATRVSIAGVPFDGSSSINLAGVNTIGNQDTSGNAATASALKFPYAINGTAFNGSGSITTSTWGTARNITIGNTTRSINGGSNASWSLSDIGALGTGNISITAGVVRNGQQIPIPAGFTRAQCKYIVSFNDMNVERKPWDIQESGSHVHIYTSCTVDQSTGMVTAWMNGAAMGQKISSVNYLCIAMR